MSRVPTPAAALQAALPISLLAEEVFPFSPCRFQRSDQIGQAFMSFFTQNFPTMSAGLQVFQPQLIQVDCARGRVRWRVTISVSPPGMFGIGVPAMVESDLVGRLTRNRRTGQVSQAEVCLENHTIGLNPGDEMFRPNVEAALRNLRLCYPATAIVTALMQFFARQAELEARRLGAPTTPPA